MYLRQQVMTAYSPKHELLVIHSFDDLDHAVAGGFTTQTAERLPLVRLLHCREFFALPTSDQSQLRADAYLIICCESPHNAHFMLYDEALFIDPTYHGWPQQVVRIQQLLAQYDVERAEQEQRLNTLRTMLTHNISHELRTPIHQIKSGLALLEEILVSHNIDTPVFSIVEDATMRLERLIENISMLTSTLEMSSGPLILRDTVRAALDTLQRNSILREQLHRVSVQLAEGLPPVRGDKNGIVMVLHLLIENGLRFSDGPVILKAERTDETVQISIEDQGIGIDQRHHQRVFEEFTQLDESSTRRHSGLGLGLTLVRMILQQHQSSVTLESSLGVGTAVRFFLPTASIRSKP